MKRSPRGRTPSVAICVQGAGDLDFTSFRDATFPFLDVALKGEENKIGRIYQKNFAAIWVPLKEDTSAEVSLLYLMDLAYPSSLLQSAREPDFTSWVELQVSEEAPFGSVFFSSETLDLICQRGLSLGAKFLGVPG